MCAYTSPANFIPQLMRAYDATSGSSAFLVLSAVYHKQLCTVGMPSAPHGEEHQHDHHRNGNEAAAAAAISPATAAIVVVPTATAGRAAEVAVESRHVLGIARVTFAEIAVIAVCHCIFLHPKCVLLLLRSFY